MSENRPDFETLVLIPARCGSKGIAHKNIRMLAEKPMLAHSIVHAQAAQVVDRIVVSTDSEAYARIAREYGAEVPFLRPTAIAGDLSTDLETFEHALSWLEQNEGYVPDLVVHLRPTHPVRNPADIDAMVRILIDYPEYDSARSVVLAPETPFKMWLRDTLGQITPVVQATIPEAYNQPRQALPDVFLQNACIDVTRTRVIREERSMTGKTIFGYVMEHTFDIDTEAQFLRAAHRLAASACKSVYCVDIDGVIASIAPSLDYRRAKPLRENITKINHLYDQGHEIILFTARGSATGLDWETVTIDQMRVWGVKYHKLLFGKPAADFYIDDKLLSINDI